jgi:hypothetical protein
MSLSLYTDQAGRAARMPITRDDREKIITGVRHLWQYCRTEEHISLSLSRFSSSSAVVKEGATNKYECMLTNNTPRNCWAKLLIDIYLKDNQTHPVGHYAYFAKRIYLTSKESQKIEFVYDWVDRAFFYVGGLKLIPDDIWRGPCKAQNKYIVRALLKNEEGQPSDELHLVQNLST